MKFLLVDTGKTKTVSVVVDENMNIIGYGLSGPADIFIREDIIKRNLMNSILKALEPHGGSINNIDLIVISWAGLDTQKQYILAERIVGELGLPRSKTHIIHDALSALYAVTMGKPGVSVIAGTGSIALGIDESGRIARSSGWGWLIGDEGSGSWIALQALNAASRAYDGRGPYTTLVERISKYFNVMDLLDILNYVYEDITRGDISRIANIAKIVDEEAIKGDEIAKSILVRAGRELANAALSIVDRLKLWNKRIIIGGVGSVFRSRIVKEVFEKELQKSVANAIIKEPYLGSQALVGCGVYALLKMNKSVDEGLLELFRKRLSKIEEDEIQGTKYIPY